MIVQLSPNAAANARVAALEKGTNPQQFVETLLEDIFSEGSIYMIFKGNHDEQKIRIINVFAHRILTEECFGFKFLSKEEAEEEAKKFIASQKKDPVEGMKLVKA